MDSNQRAILCLCQDETTLHVRRLLLERFGYRVVPANSLLGMGTLLQEYCPDMLLMDDGEWGFDCKETARAAKSICPEMLAVVLTPEWTTHMASDGPIDGFLWINGPREEWLAEIQSLFVRRDGDADRCSQRMM